MIERKEVMSKMARQNNIQDDPNKLPDFEVFDNEQWISLQKHFHLSPRQLQVAKLVCKGLTNKDIAKKLDRSVNTVKQHIKHISAKTRVTNKVSLLLRFMEVADFLNKED